jgi:SAM-dependent methyltransferase
LDPLEYQTIYRTELHHWWYRGMASITRTLLRRWYSFNNGLRILDAGCGTGAAMTTILAGYGTVTGLDLSAIALSFSRLRGADRLLQASVTHLPFPAQIFDLITCFDVLYHADVTDDALALSEFVRILVTGGRVLLRLPAYNWLRSGHDRVIHTARRYTTIQVKDLMLRSGLIIERLTYANMFLFPAVLGKRLTERMFPRRQDRSDLLINTGSLNSVLACILELEAPLLAHSSLPFGSSIFALGRKPG